MSTADNARPQRRVFTRIPFGTTVMLDTFPGQHECTLVDVSLKGALVERPQSWGVALGDPCSVTLVLAADSISIRITGEVAHVEAGRLGMRCTAIDLESMTHLRRLIGLNLGDEAALNREVHAMVHAAMEN